MILFKRFLPHLLAIGIFLLIAVIYCKPALQGMQLEQHDVTSWKGAMQQSMTFREKNGHFPLWTNSVFSGMPTFQIGSDNNNIIPGYVHLILTLGLPKPFQFFFLACICFYFLTIVLGLKNPVGIIASLGFAYATYNVIIISVGHETKMWSIAYLPALLGSILLIYNKKYWLGAALTALFAATLLAMNHPQIDYYFFIIAVIMTIFYIVNWVKAKDFKHLALALSFTIVATAIGLATNAVNILSTYEYQKATIRGGSSELTDTTKKATASTTGLDKDYAYDYSMFITEPLVMIFPRMYGGSNNYPTVLGGKGYPEMDETKSKALEALQALPQELGQQIANSASFYWGGIGNTSGPPYVGAIICFLAILSIFLVDRKYTIWAWTTIGLSIMMSWGGFFRPLNDVLFDVLPLYNKFRAPSMILVIPQLLMSFLAALSLNAVFVAEDAAALWIPFRKGLIATAGVFLLGIILYFSFTFLSDNDNAIIKQVKSINQPQLTESVQSFFNGLVDDRKSLMMDDILRALFLIGVSGGLIFLSIRKTLKPLIAVIAIGVLVLIDLFSIDTKYFNDTNYKEQTEAEATFTKTPFDESILNDKGFFRVFNLAGGVAFNEDITSYFFNSAGGYTAVKLRIYQDLISNRLAPEQQQLMQQLQSNPDSMRFVATPALNMLNVRHFIYRDQNTTKGAWVNPNALGNAWFVSQVNYVPDANACMKAIGNFNPATTAVLFDADKASVTVTPAYDSAASIQLVSNDNDKISYTSSSSVNGFGVFSEVYYQAGWKATIDGNPAPIIRTNYVLRGLNIPAGKHKIEFVFEPQGYITGNKITIIASILLLLLVAGGIFLQWRKEKS